MADAPSATDAEAPGESGAIAPPRLPTVVPPPYERPNEPPPPGGYGAQLEQAKMDASSALVRLLNDYHDDEQELKIKALFALGMMGPAALTKYAADVVKRLDESDADVRKAAYDVVEKMEKEAKEALEPHAAALEEYRRRAGTPAS